MTEATKKPRYRGFFVENIMGAAAVEAAAVNEYEFCDGDDSGDDNGENAADLVGVDPEGVAVAAATV